MTAIAKPTWRVDPIHSIVQFKVKHLMISNVTGTFRTFHGEVQTEAEDFNQALIHFEVGANSIDTNHEERNGHLKSPLFLDVAKFPKIIFDGLLKKKGEDHDLEGDLTLCAVTRSITLGAEFTGAGKGRFGDTRAGFEVNGTINRKDFGINASILTDTGNLVVGEEVKLHFDIQLIQQTA
jgi:polyisoprenoid-binding protein YceI